MRQDVCVSPWIPAVTWVDIDIEEDFRPEKAISNQSGLSDELTMLCVAEFRSFD